MDVLEAHYRGHVLMATVVRDGADVVTPDALVAAIEKRCGVLPCEACIEVACPSHDLWLSFSTLEKCTSVLEVSMKLKCYRRWIQFSRWSREIGATSGSLDFKTTLSFEGIPANAWTTESVKGVLSKLNGELIEIKPWRYLSQR